MTSSGAWQAVHARATRSRSGAAGNTLEPVPARSAALAVPAININRTHAPAANANQAQDFEQPFNPQTPAEVRAITVFSPRRPFDATGASGAHEYMLGPG